MDMIKCQNGHYYDAEKNSTCPYCANGGVNGISAAEDKTASFLDEGVGLFSTVGSYAVTESELPGSPVKNNEEDPTVAFSTPPQLEDDGKTVGYIASKREKNKSDEANPIENVNNPIVGWLVCVEGLHCGKAFELHEGRNFIGRDKNMDISLEGDHTVSRKNHAIVIYEPKHRQFYAQAGESQSLFYLNDEAVLDHKLLEDHDVIMVGETKLVFVPFCDKNFGWGV